MIVTRYLVNGMSRSGDIWKIWLYCQKMPLARGFMSVELKEFEVTVKLKRRRRRSRIRVVTPKAIIFSKIFLHVIFRRQKKTKNVNKVH